MVPPEYSVFFTTMAATGATLFGLVFLTISIAPESIVAKSAPLERQVKAATAYSALLNPLILSLFALVPHQQMSTVAIGLGVSGLISTFPMAAVLLPRPGRTDVRVRNTLFIVLGFALYSYELYCAIRLLATPADGATFANLADLLIGMAVFGVAQAWDLVGLRHFRIREWLTGLRGASEREPSALGQAAHTEQKGTAKP